MAILIRSDQAVKMLLKSKSRLTLLILLSLMLRKDATLSASAKQINIAIEARCCMLC